MNNFEQVGFMPADILLPTGCDMHKWSVVACDQYTSQPEYWDELDREIGNSPSTLRLILPEAYSVEGEELERQIARCNDAMLRYADRELFAEFKNSFVYVERTQRNGAVRRGLVGKVDLEHYDFSPDSGSLIRATEETVLSRIPPRVKLREKAVLELPHVMLLMDDDIGSVIGALQEQKQKLAVLYDFDLIGGGGHITGRLVSGENAQAVGRRLMELKDRKCANEGDVLFAMGDGNHSLATAKTIYESLKAQYPDRDLTRHPARYALVELVNIHDEALEFEPIHRVVFGTDQSRLLQAVKGPEGGERFFVRCVHGDSDEQLSIAAEGYASPVAALQARLDEYLSVNDGRIDYIHGDDVTAQLGRQDGNVAFLLDVLGKSELFSTIARGGSLPRKTFSMGEAHDKRYYLEARRIAP